MVWMKVLSLNNNQRIIDFSNNAKDNVIITFVQKTNRLTIINRNETDKQSAASSNDIPLAEWVHVAMTSRNNEVSLYLNAVKEFNYTPQFNEVERTHNYIGRSAWGSLVHAIFDEMKIFNRALSIEEIAVEKEKKQPYEIIHMNTVKSY